MEVSSLFQISNEYTEVYPPLSLKIRLAYGMGHVLNDVCASMWFTYLLVFLRLVLELDNWQTGFLLLIGQIADAVAALFICYHADKTNTWFCKYGKRKIWHLIGTVCVLIAFPFIFSTCYSCTNDHSGVHMLYYSIAIIIFQFGWAAVQISHLSLIPELSPNEHDRTKLTAVRYSFSMLSNMLVYVVTWVVLHIFDRETFMLGPEDGPKFKHVVWSVLILGLFCSAVFHYLIEESENGIGNDVRGGRVRTSVSDLLRNARVYLIAIVYMSSRLFVNLTQVFIPLYLHETLGMSASSLAVVPLVMFIGSFLTSLAIERVNRILRRRLIYLVGALLGLAACIWIKCSDGSNHIYVVALLMGSAGSIVLVTSLGAITDFIGEKTDRGAFIFGIMSFMDKVAHGVVVAIIQHLHTDSSNTNYYKDILTNVCGAFVVIGAITMMGVASNMQRTRRLYQDVTNYNSVSLL